MFKEGREAKLPYKVVEKGTQRIVYDFDGRRVDLGPNVQDKPEKGQVELSCERCSLVGGVFEAEGMGYAALNQAKRDAVAYLRGNCGKWIEKVAMERSLGFNISDTAPDKFLPPH